MTEFITHIDTAILDFLQAHVRCAFLDAVLPRFSALGNGGFLWLLLAILFLLFKAHRKRGTMIILGLFVGFLAVSVVLKPLCARPRPSWISDVALLIPNPTDFSFPSGHTASSFIAAFLITAYRPRLGFLVLPSAALMAFSRLYLYVHYPSDILFSILLAAAIAWGITRAAARMDRKKE